VRLPHKEFLTKGKLTMLKMAAEQVIASMHNDISIKTFNGDSNLYNNFQKLRYHGLVYYAHKDNSRVRGHWLITRNGWAFLRGDITLPKFVVIRNNHILTKSDQEISVRDVYYGSDVLQTTFEYFDNEGNAVGWKPTRQMVASRQVSLI
jgi:hypothetical protein